MVEEYGRKCLLLRGDIRKERHCTAIVNKTLKQFGQIDILVNNAAIQIEAKTLEDVKTSDLVKTFETNIFSMFWITKAVLSSMKKGGSIINTTSVTAYGGSPTLIPYASTKGDYRRVYPYSFFSKVAERLLVNATIAPFVDA